MLQTFYINKDSELPILRMELIEDGIHDYRKFHRAIQNADITFTMVNEDNGITKISKANAYVQLRDDTTCTEQYVICYNWKKRDTNESGNFKGTFDITFNPIKTDDGKLCNTGLLKMPIREELRIVIR